MCGLWIDCVDYVQYVIRYTSYHHIVDPIIDHRRVDAGEREGERGAEKGRAGRRKTT